MRLGTDSVYGVGLVAISERPVSAAIAREHLRSQSTSSAKRNGRFEWTRRCGARHAGTLAERDRDFSRHNDHQSSDDVAVLFRNEQLPIDLAALANSRLHSHSDDSASFASDIRSQARVSALDLDPKFNLKCCAAVAQVRRRGRGAVDKRKVSLALSIETFYFERLINDI